MLRCTCGCPWAGTVGDVSSRGRVARASLALLAVGVFWQMPVSSAAFVATTVNPGNGASTLAVAPPGSVTATLSLNVLPPSCRASLAWTASTTPGVTGYEIVRLDMPSETVVGGPWTTAGLTRVDTPVPLWLLGGSDEWRVRSVFGTWRSSWATATVSNPLLCLI